LNIQPTQVEEIEGGLNVDDVRKIAMPLPFNPPSPTLFQLLGFLVEAGKGVIRTSMEDLPDSQANAPVGTTLARIEQGMVVFSSIHSRLHNSMARCFKILHRINSAYLTEEDIEANYAGLEIDPSDFDGPMDVIPVSDPQIFSDTQRFVQTQALMQRAALLPQMYDQRKVEERFLRDMKIPENEVLQPKPGSEDMDPVSENVAAAMGRPIYVLPKQDHMAHLQTHVAFLKSPLFGSNPAIVKQYLYPMAIHLRDHLLNYYLVEAHNAVDMAQRDQLIQSEANEQVQVILKVQQFIEQQLGSFANELAQIDQAAQQFKPQPPMPPDNSMQIAQINAGIQQQALQQRAQSDAQRMQLEQQKLAQSQQSEQMSMAEKERARQLELQREQLRQSAEDQRTAADLAIRERMNTADNQTAIDLAKMEILSGEKFSVSTGTGINPGAR
jgi:hypothetical protein